MSGCVNCVWDLFRDEMEEWAVKRKEADHALRKEKSLEGARKKRRRDDAGMGGSTGTELTLGQAEEDNTTISTDDDGGGSERLWGKSLDSDVLTDDLYKNIPVGIREFMKQEKKLKEKRAREAGTGA
jgi:Oxidoreductase-like protein, N-terminal